MKPIYIIYKFWKFVDFQPSEKSLARNIECLILKTTAIGALQNSLISEFRDSTAFVKEKHHQTKRMFCFIPMISAQDESFVKEMVILSLVNSLLTRATGYARSYESSVYLPSMRVTFSIRVILIKERYCKVHLFNRVCAWLDEIHDIRCILEHHIRNERCQVWSHHRPY